MAIYSFKEIYDRITPVLDKYDVGLVAVFGSYARGEAREDSDIDFHVWGTDHLDFGDLLRFEDELELVLDKKVSVVTDEAISDWFWSKIEEDEVYLCDRKRKRLEQAGEDRHYMQKD